MSETCTHVRLTCVCFNRAVSRESFELRQSSIICLLAACVCGESSAQDLAPEWKEVQAAIKSRCLAIGAIRYKTQAAGSLNAKYFEGVERLGNETSKLKTPDVLPFVYKLSDEVWLDYRTSKFRRQHDGLLLTESGMNIQAQTSRFDGVQGITELDNSHRPEGVGGVDRVRFSKSYAARHLSMHHSPMFYAFGFFADDDWFHGVPTDLGQSSVTWRTKGPLLIATVPYSHFVRTITFDRRVELNVVEVDDYQTGSFGGPIQRTIRVSYDSKARPLLPTGWQPVGKTSGATTVEITDLQRNWLVDDSLFKLQDAELRPGVMVLHDGERESGIVAKNE